MIRSYRIELDRFRKEYFVALLRQSNKNFSQASRTAKIGANTLYRHLQDLGIHGVCPAPLHTNRWYHSKGRTS